MVYSFFPSEVSHLSANQRTAIISAVVVVGIVLILAILLTIILTLSITVVKRRRNPSSRCDNRNDVDEGYNLHNTNPQTK